VLCQRSADRWLRERSLGFQLSTVRRAAAMPSAISNGKITTETWQECSDSADCKSAVKKN